MRSLALGNIGAELVTLGRARSGPPGIGSSWGREDGVVDVAVERPALGPGVAAEPRPEARRGRQAARGHLVGSEDEPDPDVELSVDEESDHLGQGDGRGAVRLVREELGEGQGADPDLDRPLLVPDLAPEDRAGTQSVVAGPRHRPSSGRPARA